jgi:hypothetical protein
MASFTLPARSFALSRPEQTKPPGMASTSTPKPLRAAQVLGDLARHDGPQLHHAVVAAPGPAGTDDDTLLVESQVRRVEEEDLTYLGLEGVHLEGLDRGPLVTVGHGQLQLHGVSTLQQGHQLLEAARA